MARTRYRHSAYWYAKNYGYTYSEATSYTERYLDHVNCACRMGNGSPILGDGITPAFNPFIFAVYIAMDIGVAMQHTAKTLADPDERNRIKRELMQELRIVRRPFYYARENERRRELAAARRKLHRRTTTAPMPTPEALRDAWDRRKDSKENMIILGGMLHDLECYVDNCLKIDEDGKVVGRNGGIRGWLKAALPDLAPKYKTLMRYKAMAIRLRQATGTKDPKPTDALLTESPRHEVMQELLEDFRITFSSLDEALNHLLDPNAVFLDKAPVKSAADIRKRRMKALKKARKVRARRAMPKKRPTARRK